MNTKPILGQEVICPDGLGRVADFGERTTSGSLWIKVDTYIGNRGCHWDEHSVELLEIQGRI